ncbi:MAG: hypothetical protein HC828_02705 [Blastochloris sp.]|nr:hypothetical protein [Blastochloris sp.]
MTVATGVTLICVDNGTNVTTSVINRGSLIIVKELTPADGTDAERITFTDILPGAYALTETLQVDWQLNSASV